VTFSLRNPNKDYSQFFVTLRGNALNWWHYIEQTVVVSTQHDAHNFATQLLPNIETTDSLLVAEINYADCSGWLPQFAWEWLRDTSKQIGDQKFKEILSAIKPTPLIR
jgi:hypothetical protein